MTGINVDCKLCHVNVTIRSKLHKRKGVERLNTHDYINISVISVISILGISTNLTFLLEIIVAQDNECSLSEPTVSLLFFKLVWDPYYEYGSYFIDIRYFCKTCHHVPF